MYVVSKSLHSHSGGTMSSRPAKLLLIFSSLALGSCSGGSSGSGPIQMTSPPLPIVRSYAFTPGTALASTGTAWDIIGVRTTLTGRFANGSGDLYDTVKIDVSFAQDISNALPSPGSALKQANQLGINIGFDSDNNPSTGHFLSCDLSNRTLTPFEYVTDQGNSPSRLFDGNYSIINSSNIPISSGPNADPASEAVVSTSGNVLTESIYLPAIGANSGSVIPKFGIEVISYNGSSTSPTDCVPSDGRITLPVN